MVKPLKEPSKDPLKHPGTPKGPLKGTLKGTRRASPGHRDGQQGPISGEVEARDGCGERAFRSFPQKGLGFRV